MKKQKEMAQKGQISRSSKEVNNICEICNNDFIAIRKSACCSERCRQIHRSNKKLENKDHITCPVCKQKVKQITVQHARSHGYNTTKEMQEDLDMQTITCETVKDKVRGENNPGFNHGGKFSKFSKNFIHGYDKEWHEEQSKKHSKFRNENKELFKTNIEYWLEQTNGSQEEAERLYKEFQIRDLAYFINKYGEKEGNIRYKQKIEKWIKTLDEKPLQEKMDINSRKVRKSSAFYSKAEKELFDALQAALPDITDQFALPVDNHSYNKQAYLYDMVYETKIIEYNGDFWHSNPMLFEKEHICPYTKRTQKEIHDKDTDKIRIAKNHGYTVKVIWEQDYNKDKEKVIQECLNFLKK
jgi:hypothetical protein